jgi:hypothetical protein
VLLLLSTAVASIVDVDVDVDVDDVVSFSVMAETLSPARKRPALTRRNRLRMIGSGRCNGIYCTINEWIISVVVVCGWFRSDLAVCWGRRFRFLGKRDSDNRYMCDRVK